MSKLTEYIKIILTIILSFLTIKYIFTYGIEFNNFINYCFIYFIFVTIMISDYLKKNDIQQNSRYNLLVIISFTIISIVFLRTLYDKSFLSNSQEYLEDIGLLSDDLIPIFKIDYYGMFYLYQNIFFFILMLIGLLVYREVNIKEKNKKYNRISIICLALTILLFSTKYFRDNSILLIISVFILLIVETWSLIKYNHKRREWTVYVGWFWHVFAIIGYIFDLL